MDNFQVGMIASAILDGCKEIAAAIRAGKPEPQQEEKPLYHCPACGSPRWSPGGMGQAFKQCLDCGHIGDAIEDEA